MILREWKRIALITITVTAIAWSLTALQTPRYRAIALASVAPVTEGLQPNEMLRGMEVLERRTLVETIAALAGTPVTRRSVAAGSGYRVQAEVVPNTNLFRVAVEGSDAAQTAAIANRVPQVLSAQARELYKYYNVAMVSPAVAPDAPFLPQTGRAIAGGLLIGLFLGIVTAYVQRLRVVRRATAA
jgi:capsular polysaccharide biosynthesis protein